MFRLAILALVMLTIVFGVDPAVAAEFPKSQGRVNDFAALLSPSLDQKLENKLEKYEKRSGNSVIVITVNSLSGLSSQEYALGLMDKWGMRRQRAVVFLVAKAERQVRIQPGAHTGGNLTNRAARTILTEQVLPSFKAGDFDRGVERGADSIVRRLGEVTPVAEEEVSVGPAASSGRLLDLLFWCTCLALFFSFSRRVEFRRPAAPAALIGAIWSFARHGWPSLALLTVVFLILRRLVGSKPSSRRPRRKKQSTRPAAKGTVARSPARRRRTSGREGTIT